MHALHEDGAVAQQLRGAELVQAVAAVGSVRVQRGGGGDHGFVPPAGQAVHERSRLHQVAFGAVGGESVAGLRECQRRVRVGSVQVPAEEEEEEKVSGTRRENVAAWILQVGQRCICTATICSEAQAGVLSIE